MNLPPVTSHVFTAIQNLDLDELAKCSQRELRPILSSLVRMSFLWPYDSTGRGQELRRQVFTMVIDMESVNNIVALLQVSDFELDIEVRKEQQLRQKWVGTGQQQDTAQFHGLHNGLALGFEGAEVKKKVRYVLSELFYLQTQILEFQSTVAQKNESILKRSDLFDNEIYLEEIADIICIAMAELPFLFTVQEIVDILLYLQYGQGIICWIIANMPDCFKDVVNALITNGDEETPEGRLRLQTLYALCEMNPAQALSVRALCVDLAKMPSLMVKLSLQDPQDLISFVSGLLLGNDQGTRSWFAVFVRTSQKRKGDALLGMRKELLNQLQELLTLSIASQWTDECVVQSAQLLRLYCALRGIAGIKFNDDEIQLLMQLITTKPPPTLAGIRFVSLGLCMLIACTSLIQQPPLETKAVEWIQWLIKEEVYFESNTGMSGSFGEMLLLMAIHFHSNQLTAICDLVCSTLGMKVPLRPNTTNRMKQIFTQDIFTEQVVTAHAVKVSVTPSLNASIPGYLPVHCIHQLLKSRAFSKHKVPIKSWIYKQICNSTVPLHPVLPALIEVYVNSIIVPHAKTPVEHTHKALSEEEILRVFQNSVVATNVAARKKIYTYDYTFDVDTSSAHVDDMAVSTSGVTSQLLLLYYLMLYEDVRLSNMASILSTGRKVKSYSTEFMTELPIKYLLQQAQKNQQEFTGLFSPLLKLLATHFPHLTLVDDWLDEETISTANKKTPAICQAQIVDAFETLQISPAKAIKLLRLMMKKSPTELWPFAEIFIRYFKYILDADVPRLVQELYKQIWIRLNTILPRRLWVMSINALMPEDYITKSHLLSQELMLSDPLQVLRCDSRVFRCPDALAVVLRILQASLAASKSQLTRHILDKPLLESSGQLQTDVEREELKMALVASQESVAVQILLESCLETKEDANTPGGLCFLRESRGIICSYIHQAFISEPSLAKLVHFQGYPRELLSMTVRGIPSMHICLDFLHELLNMPQMDKQIFAIDLASHLSMQYSLPKSMSVAKLCINTLTTLLGILTNDSRVEMFRAVMPCIVRFAEAFPPLLDDCLMFLMQLGRIAESQAALGRSNSLPNLSMSPVSRVKAQTKRTQYAEQMVEDVRETFSQLLDKAVLKPKIY